MLLSYWHFMLMRQIYGVETKTFCAIGIHVKHFRQDNPVLRNYNRNGNGDVKRPTELKNMSQPDIMIFPMETYTQIVYERFA